MILLILFISQCNKKRIQKTDHDHVYMFLALERPTHIWDKWQGQFCQTFNNSLLCPHRACICLLGFNYVFFARITPGAYLPNVRTSRLLLTVNHLHRTRSPRGLRKAIKPTVQLQERTAFGMVQSLTAIIGLDSKSSCIVDRAEGRLEDIIMISYHKKGCMSCSLPL